jgi:CRISPR system Cascade subunit CasE
MNWLARMEISTEAALADDVLDSYDWHQRLWQCFPGQPDRKRDYLTRIDVLEGAFRLWLLSPSKPIRPVWCSPKNFAIKEIVASFLSHRYYAFDLRANPVKCLVQRDEQGNRKGHGKRVPLTDPNTLRTWIVRRGETGGFRVLEEQTLEIGPVVGSHFCISKRNQAAYHGGVQFRGMLEVTDNIQFAKTYLAGVGSAKGFGFGLLLLAPVNL